MDTLRDVFPNAGTSRLAYPAGTLLPEGKQPKCPTYGNHNQEACLQADGDIRKSMLAGPRSEEVGFAHDPALEGDGFELPVPRE